MPLMLGKIIGGALIWVSGRLVYKVLIALGLSVVTFIGLEVVLNNAISYGISRLNGLPSEVLSVVAYMKIGVCVAMLVSAYSGRLVMKMGGSSVLKRWAIGA